MLLRAGAPQSSCSGCDPALFEWIGVIWSYFGLYEVIWGDIGIMEKNMEISIWGLGFRV